MPIPARVGHLLEQQLKNSPLFERILFHSSLQLGEVFPAPVDVLLSPLTVVQPDLVFVAQGRRDIITERAIEGPPDLVVEILSPTTAEHDRQQKAQIYARYGIPHYWIVAPDQRQLEVYELTTDTYHLVSTHSGNMIFQPTLFLDLPIPLADFWAWQ